MVREQGAVGRGAGEMVFLTRNAEPTAEADRGRHPGFRSFNVLSGGPGSLAERSAKAVSAMANGVSHESPELIESKKKALFELRLPMTKGAHR